MFYSVLVVCGLLFVVHGEFASTLIVAMTVSVTATRALGFYKNT